MMSESSLSCEEAHVLSQPLSQHTHLKQGSRFEISWDPVAPTLRRTITAGENSLWEVESTMEESLKRGLADSSGKQAEKFLFPKRLLTSTDKKIFDNILTYRKLFIPWLFEQNCCMERQTQYIIINLWQNWHHKVMVVISNRVESVHQTSLLLLNFQPLNFFFYFSMIKWNIDNEMTEIKST